MTKKNNPEPPKKINIVELEVVLNFRRAIPEWGRDGDGLERGTRVLVRADMAGRYLTQYNPHFKQIGAIREADKLKDGFYEVIKLNKPEPKPESKIGKPSDRSMGTSRGAARKGK